MKHAFIFIALLLIPSVAGAQVAFPNRGGTGTSTVPQYGQVLMGFPNGTYGPVATSSLGIIGTGATTPPGGGNGQLQYNSNGSFEGTSSPVVGYITATRTDATSTLPRLSVTGAFNFLGTVITDVSAWFSGLFNTNFASKTTTDLTEGGNLYYTDSRSRSALSETVTGLDYSNSTGITSLTAGYVIPLSASTTQWNTFYTTPSSQITAGSGLSWSGNTLSATAATVYLASSSPWTTGSLARVSSNGAVTSIATSALALLITDTTGTLTETRGGTNQTTYAAGDFLYASGANTLTKRTIGSTGNILMVQSGVPTWVATSSLGISSGNSTVYLASSTGGFTTGNLAYVSGAGTIGGVATGTLTDSVTGLQISAARSLIGGSADISLTAGYEIPLTASTTQFKQSYDWAVATGTLTETVTGLSFSGTPRVLNTSSVLTLDAGYSVPTTSLLTAMSAFDASPSSRCVEITGSAALCDGVDDTASGGSGLGTTSPWTVGQMARVASNGAVTSIATSAMALAISDTTGTLTETRGGTNQATYATGDILYASSANTLSKLAVGTTGQVLMVSSGVPTWTSTSSLGFLSSTTGDWTGTFDGQEGTWYRDRGNHTGTQLSSTISDFTTAVQALSLGTTSNPTTGQVAFFTGARTLASLATTTLTAGTNVSLSGTPVIFGSSPISITANVPLSFASSSPFTTGDLVFASNAGRINTVATGTLSETVTGLELSASRALVGGSAILALTSGFVIPTSTLWTSVADFYQTPSTRITAGANCSWAGNTFNCEGGGGGGGGALSTTTDIVGDGGVAAVSYVTGDVMFGGSSSTTAEFQLDDDGAKFIISTSSVSATTTIANVNSAAAVQFGVASNSDSAAPLVRGVHWSFASTTQAIVTGFGEISAVVFKVALTIQDTTLTIANGVFNAIGATFAYLPSRTYVATTTYNGATTTDVMVTQGYINSGEYIEEFCTSAAAETTQLIADTLRGCGRYAYLEDANGVIDFVTPTTGTTSYFRIRPGATGVSTAAGDGMGIGWASGIDFGDIQKNAPAMEWAMRQDALNFATSTLVLAGITSAVSISADFAAEPAQGFYVMATTTPNWLFACNPSTGGTTYIDTGIASSTFPTGAANPFVHFRLEVSGTANTAVTALLKARTATTSLNQVATCTLDLSASTQVVAPTIAIGKSTAVATGAPELHVPWLKFWYRTPLF